MKENLDMSIQNTVEVGFISKQSFEDACQVLCGFSVASGQSELRLVYNQEVRSCTTHMCARGIGAVRSALVACGAKLRRRSCVVLIHFHLIWKHIELLQTLIATSRPILDSLSFHVFSVSMLCQKK